MGGDRRRRTRLPYQRHPPKWRIGWSTDEMPPGPYPHVLWRLSAPVHPSEGKYVCLCPHQPSLNANEIYAERSSASGRRRHLRPENCTQLTQGKRSLRGFRWKSKAASNSCPGPVAWQGWTAVHSRRTRSILHQTRVREPCYRHAWLNCNALRWPTDPPPAELSKWRWR